MKDSIFQSTVSKWFLTLDFAGPDSDNLLVPQMFGPKFEDSDNSANRGQSVGDAVLVYGRSFLAAMGKNWTTSCPNSEGSGVGIPVLSFKHV